MNLEGKVIVVTGGEGPLGSAVSKKLLQDGAKLVIGWFADDEWKEAKELITGFKGKYVDLKFDATNEEEAAKLMKLAKETYGKIDALVHTVGLYAAGKTLWETDFALQQKLIDVNFKSSFLCAKHVIKYMLEKQNGRIIFFPAHFAIDPPAGVGAYSVSKGALVTYISALREDLKGTNITVNGIMPHGINTPKTRKFAAAEVPKMTLPEDIADLVSCVCSDETRALSGSLLKVLGGF
jgi:3-oxoacyl-[acyl-carrier protein] reductase